MQPINPTELLHLHLQVVQTAVDDVKEKSTADNNPNHLLFVRLDGKRKGRCPQGLLIQPCENPVKKHQNRGCSELMSLINLKTCNYVRNTEGLRAFAEQKQLETATKVN